MPWPAGAGIKTNVSLAALQALGWSTCFTAPYNSTGTTTDSILAGCTGTYMMMACRASSATDTLTVVAADTRAVVTTVDASNTGFHASNNGGVGWYFGTNWSWGFFPLGQAVNRSSCDVAPASPEQRLCWHTGGGAINGGYRCGATIGLNADATFQRLILVR